MKYIDLLKAKKRFNKYVADFDANNSKIARKIKHTYRVMNYAKIIATNIGFDEENIELAQLIALLHDLGRFIQERDYHTFNDNNSIDHADLAVEILFGDKGIIREFITEDKYDAIIYVAIKNHNKFKIQSDITELELKHAKCIRDSDKLDIFPGFINTKYKYFEKEDLENAYITDKVYESILNCKSVLLTDMKNQNVDVILLKLALVFDLNYNISLKIVREQKFIEQIVNKHYDLLNEKTKKKIKEAEKIVLNYIDSKIK